MCDTLARVTSRGVLFAKSSDRDPNEGQGLTWTPRAEHEDSAVVRCTWLEIPQARRTWATLVSRPFWGWGAEIGANEHGVTIGNEAVFTRRRVPKVGLTGMDLVRLALERADSARRAVELIQTLSAEHGQGGGCGFEDPSFRYFSSFLVADPYEAWVLETAGEASEAERIEGARSISNTLSIPRLRRALRDPVRSTFAAGDRRAAITLRHAESATRPLDLAAALRDHGTPDGLPRYAWHHGAMAAPCMHGGGVIASSQTTASWIAELTPRGARHWVTATAAPCTSIFKPVRVDEPLDLGPFPGGTPDASLFWKHERFHRGALRDPAAWLPLAARERADLELCAFEGQVEPAEAFRDADDKLERWLTLGGDFPGDDTRPICARRYWAART